ncbi:MAG: 3-deoxy-D-manno-octulosonic acid transferase [Planctomycetes bacterium]|nr:3-deoxy-D-manno-octulosonic acid transferase [Planctomycetota bacterium]
MKGLLLDSLYAIALAAGSPFWLYRMIRHGRYKTDLGQRLGGVPVNYGRQPTIWIHAVSLGEVNAARTLVGEIHSQLPDYRVVVSTTTDTGMTAAKKLFAFDHIIFRWPLDFSFAVHRALDRIHPSLVLLMEGEVWPNFLAQCNARQIPVAVVNARIGADKGYPRYKRMGRLAGEMFNRLSMICAQDESYAGLFRSLGVRPEKIAVTGMLKYDTAIVADRIDGQDLLAAAVGLGADERLIVAGGTGPGEEQIVLDAYRKLAAKHPRVRLAIVPRKPERFDEVADLIAQTGMGLVRRSKCPDGQNPASEPDTGGTAGTGRAVILGDTMGELRKFYGLACGVFVGRSLVPMGGSDMIESAALGRPTAFGPHTFNFPQAGALAAHGCARVGGADELLKVLDGWLTAPASAAAAGKAARDFVIASQGATKRSVAEICRILGRVPAVAPGCIATDVIRESRP